MPKFFCMPFFACNRQVDSLDKRQCNLQTVPHEVERYARSLEELLLDMNHIKELPKSLFRLHRLQRLGISDNDVVRLPADIANLQNLMELNLSKNDISDIPEELKSCRNLRMLDVSSNPIARLPDSITQVISLTHLNLNDTSLTKLPTDLGNLQNLKSLEVRENLLHTLPASLYTLVNLQRLDIGQNELDEIPNEIYGLKSLKELYIDENHLEELPEGILTCRLLEQLDLSSNKLMKLPEGLGELDRLTDLILSQNCLQYMPNSIRLLKRLQILKVDNNNLSSLTSAIGSCVSLQELYLMHNLLQELPSTISNLRKLEVLNVDKNHLTAMPSLIGNCESLTVLSFRDNQVKDLPLEVGKLVKLRVLDVCGNQLRYLPFTINVLFNLQALWLSENQSQALLKFQQVQDPVSNMRVLTCYLLPQQPGQVNPEQLAKQQAKNNFVGGPKVHFGGVGDSTMDDEEAALLAPQNFERHDTPHPKPHQGKVKKSSIDGHVIPHHSNNNPTNISLSRKASSEERQDPPRHSQQQFSGPRSSLKHPSPHQPFAESSSSDNLAAQADKLNTSTTMSASTPVPTTIQPQPSALERETKRIVIRRSASNNTGLGLSIAGGIESTPFVENDAGLFISKLTPGGAAELSGLRVGDKLIEVNGTNMVGQRHDVAVQCMQKPVDSVTLVIQREQNGSQQKSIPKSPNPSSKTPERESLPIKTLTHEIRSGASPNSSITVDERVHNKDVISTTVSKDSKGSPGFSLTQSASDIVISAIKPGGPADKEHKLRVGDVLLSVNGSSLQNLGLEQIGNRITSTPGEVFLVVQRRPNSANKTPHFVNLSVTNGINALPYSDTSRDGSVDTVELMRDENNSLGLSIVGGIDHCSHPFGVNNPGVFISKIAPDSPAANSGALRIGDRILSVNKEMVEKARHNDAVMALKNSGKKLILQVRHEPRPAGLREIVFRRRLNEPIGLSICGGINSPPANPSDSTDEGIFIEKVERGSAAEDCGLLKPGIRVLEINDDSLLGCTQVEAANLFRKADSIIRLLVCDGYAADSKNVSLLSQKLPMHDTPSFPARKTPEYQNQLSQSYVNIPVNGTNNNGIAKVSQILRPQIASPGVPLNFSEPPLAASSPIPATASVSYSIGSNSNGYRNGASPNTSAANASTSFSVGFNDKSSPVSTNNNSKISSPAQSATTFLPSSKAPPPVAPKPKVIPIIVENIPTTPQNQKPPEALTLTSKIKRFESEIASQTQSNGSSNNNGKPHSVSTSALPLRKSTVLENDNERNDENRNRRQDTPETSMESALNTSNQGPQVVRTKKAESRLAALVQEPLNAVEKHELDIRKRHEWRQARMASLDAETETAKEIVKELTAKRLAHISEERSVSTSPSRVLHNESSVENFSTTENGNKIATVVEKSITQREFDLSQLSKELEFMDD